MQSNVIFLTQQVYIGCTWPWFWTDGQELSWIVRAGAFKKYICTCKEPRMRFIGVLVNETFENYQLNQFNGSGSDKCCGRTVLGSGYKRSKQEIIALIYLNFLWKKHFRSCKGVSSGNSAMDTKVMYYFAITRVWARLSKVTWLRNLWQQTAYNFTCHFTFPCLAPRIKKTALVL